MVGCNHFFFRSLFTPGCTDIPVIADGGGGGSGSVTPSQDMYWLQLILIHLRISPSREGERD